MSNRLNKNEVFEVIKQKIVKVLPGISKEQVDIGKSLSELGANSIDRMEVVVLSMESIGIKFPLVELAEIKNLEGLVEFFYNKSNN